MTKTVYITGDRSMAPLAAVDLVAIILHRIVRDDGGDVKIVTGNAAMGVERAVRYLLPENAVGVVPYKITEEGALDFEETHTELAKYVDTAIVLHSDPLTSKVAKSVMQHFAADKVEFPLDEVFNEAPDTLEDLLTDLEEPPAEEE